MITKKQALESIDALAEPGYRIPAEVHVKLLCKYVEQCHKSLDDYDTRHIELAASHQESLALEVDQAVQNFIFEPIEVCTDPDGNDNAPEAWAEKPFCRVQFATDKGDDSVGIPEVSGYYLASDQSGTIVADLIKRDSDLVKRDEYVAQYAKLLDWLDSNTTFYNTDNPSRALESVSKRIWIHATNDLKSYPFSSMVYKAMKNDSQEDS